MAVQIKMPLGMEVGLSPGDFLLDEDPAPPPKFSAHVYCGQTAGWITMVIGMEIGFSRGDFVLDGDMDSERDGCHGTQAVIFD